MKKKDKEDCYKIPVPYSLREDYDRRIAVYKNPKIHENFVASELDGRTQFASGAIEGFKGDVSGVEGGVFRFLFECKTTKKKSLSIKGKWLNKITDEVACDEYPALAIRFDKSVLEALDRKNQKKTGYGGEVAEADWVCVPLSVFRKMLVVLDSLDSLEGVFEDE